MVETVRSLHLFAGTLLFICLVRTGLAARYGGNYEGRCSLLDQTIFCFGGYSDLEPRVATNAFFGLNISQPITLATAETSWVDLTIPSNNVEIEANANFAMTSVPQRGLLVVDGGDGYNHTNLDRQTSIYFPSNNTWINVAVSESEYPQMFDETMTADAEGNILYLWGGETTFSNSTGFFSYPLEMKTFNFQTRSWARLSAPSNGILPRIFHTATLGKDNRTIYFFGGIDVLLLVNETDNTYYNSLQYAEFSETPSYDTMNDSWNLTAVRGNVVPSSRYMHATTLIGSGEIVLYGGIYVPLPSEGDLRAYPSADYFYILNTDTMAWRNLTLGTSIDAGPGPLHAHSAVYAGNDSLFILFGVSTTGMNNRFSILDTKQWAWTTTFGGIHPTPVSNATETPSDVVVSRDGDGGDGGGELSSGGIAGVVVGVIAGLAIIAIAGFFLYRTRRKSAAAASTKERTTMDPMSNPKMSEEFSSSGLSPTLQQEQQQSAQALKTQPIPPDTAVGKPDIHSSNVIHGDGIYVPQLRMGPIMPDGE